MKQQKTKKYFIFLLLILSFTLSACFRQGEPTSKKDAKKTQQEQANKPDNKKKTENKNDFILKKVRVDENGWNVYESEKYGFEFSAPRDWSIEKYGKYQNREYIILESKNFKAPYNILSVQPLLNAKNLNVNNEKDYIKYRCDQKSKDYDRCVKYYQQAIKDYFKVNDNFVVKTDEITGAGGVTSTIYYIFAGKLLVKFEIDDGVIKNDDEGIFEQIVKTFKTTSNNQNSLEKNRYKQKSLECLQK